MARLTRDGGKITLADAYQGRRLNSPNDLVVKTNGDIYITAHSYLLRIRTTTRGDRWRF